MKANFRELFLTGLRPLNESYKFRGEKRTQKTCLETHLPHILAILVGDDVSPRWAPIFTKIIFDCKLLRGVLISGSCLGSILCFCAILVWWVAFLPGAGCCWKLGSKAWALGLPFQKTKEVCGWGGRGAGALIFPQYKLKPNLLAQSNPVPIHLPSLPTLCLFRRALSMLGFF